MKLNKKYESIVDEYTLLFINKHFNSENEVYSNITDAIEDNYGYWIGDRKGEILSIGDYFFRFDDIRFDIDSNIKGDTILDWHNYCIENERLNINFENYCKLCQKPEIRS